MTTACSIRVRGVVQGVGFRPFVFHLARENDLAGWVLNQEEGVEIHLEGAESSLRAFLDGLSNGAPAAARITDIDVEPRPLAGLGGFTIRDSAAGGKPTTHIAPDLAVCEDCLAELFDPADPRYHYPYINCTNCGPRFSIILGLPYDRPSTTMRSWPMDGLCSEQYHDPANRRFHAQPTACPSCGPRYILHGTDGQGDVIESAARLLGEGRILAVKGLGGYHLACDATNSNAVTALRERKYRKEKPFAVMARDVETARRLADFSDEAEALMVSAARPIVLARARAELPGVAPDNHDIGIMLPYTPLHHLLFAAGAPAVLVMTSANRSSEPIAYVDEDAFHRLHGIADVFLVGERPIARRVEDSIVRDGPLGPTILRRSRGLAPGAVTRLPAELPILAVGADLKNSVTLVVDGQAFVSQYIGDLDQYSAYQAFRETIDDLLAMYRVDLRDTLVVRDAHPQYRSSVYASSLEGADLRIVQHHRAHVASVLAERGEFERRVLGLSFDGTGFGDDGAIWGGEFFVGSLKGGFDRVAHLRQASLAGGDAAAEHPVQAAAGFLANSEGLPDVEGEPFCFPARYLESRQLLNSNTRVFPTTSVGRLFDAAAALLGFIRPMTFEGQAAIWLEQLARSASTDDAYPFPFDGRELDFRPLLLAVAKDRVRGRDPREIADAFHAGLARGIRDAVRLLCDRHGLETIVLSGGVFQNQLLLRKLVAALSADGLDIWTNHAVPPNDGGISLGQAALAALLSSRAA